LGSILVWTRHTIVYRTRSSNHRLQTSVSAPQSDEFCVAQRKDLLMRLSGIVAGRLTQGLYSAQPISNAVFNWRCSGPPI